MRISTKRCVPNEHCSTLMLRRRVFNGDFMGVLGVFGDFGDITSSSSGAESSGPHADAGTVAWRKTSFMEVFVLFGCVFCDEKNELTMKLENAYTLSYKIYICFGAISIFNIYKPPNFEISFPAFFAALLNVTWKRSKSPPPKAAKV